jgi:hypothetical protein
MNELGVNQTEKVSAKHMKQLLGEVDYQQLSASQLQYLVGSNVGSKVVASCPSGWTQDIIGNDIFGCGLTSCEIRYDEIVSTPALCAARCDEITACKAFSWAPVDGDKDHPGQTVCTIYSEDAPTQWWKSVTNQDEQVFCKRVQEAAQQAAVPTILI